jgi:hypothetical protein
MGGETPLKSPGFARDDRLALLAPCRFTGLGNGEGIGATWVDDVADIEPGVTPNGRGKPRPYDR